MAVEALVQALAPNSKLVHCGEMPGWLSESRPQFPAGLVVRSAVVPTGPLVKLAGKSPDGPGWFPLIQGAGPL